MGTFGTAGTPARYLAADTALAEAQPGTKVRLGFQLHNAGGPSTTVRPLLQFRADGADFAAVPADFQLGAPLRMSAEWVTVPGGTAHGPSEAVIRTDDLGLPAPAGRAVAGHRTMAANPSRPVTLAPGQYTEVEFTVAISTDATYATTYTLRLVDGPEGTPIPGARITVTTGGEPEQSLSPGQRSGLDMPPTGTRAGPRGGSAVRTYALQVPDREVAAAAAASTVREPVHGPYALATSACASCHRTHTATGTSQVTTSGSLSTLCFLCHDGTGSRLNILAQYDGATPNDPSARAYYQHDAITPTTGADAHTIATDDEFGGVSNRHSGCTDCHNPHSATTTPATQSSQGWRVSGRMQAVTGVKVTNGAPGTAPRYSFLDTRTASPALEYQICFKCHSGFTTLPSNDGFPPSQQILDKGVELNPANSSFHPIQAPGTNTTSAMATNLAGTSPYKKWDFTASSTIRCTHCHADPQASTGTVTTSADLPAHTSANRGLLLAPYRNRVLKRAGEAYSAADFALCFLCHAEEPFRRTSSAATGFRRHYRHVMQISGGDTSTDIDEPGAGFGRAICAECHFRTHSTTFAVGEQVVDGSRLVNFAPNVEPITIRGVTYQPTFTRSVTSGPGQGGGGNGNGNGGGNGSGGGGTTGSCTLTCHGARHVNWRY